MEEPIYPKEVNDVPATYEPLSKNIGTDFNYKHEIVWPIAIGLLLGHIIAAYGFVYLFIGEYKTATAIWVIVFIYMGTAGVTIGAHRYFSHKSFKAKTPLKILLLLLHASAGQDNMYVWVRNHRLHHLYTDTDGDPHNAKRGFWFCHYGWLMSRKHPLIHELGKNIDMSDLINDPLVMFQKKYYHILHLIFGVWLSVAVPVYLWNEDWKVSILLAYFYRYILQVNFTLLGNSMAHLWGTRPYDKNFLAVESAFLSLISFGEGWHNYHHTFPWDYRAAEESSPYNFAASIIRLFERIGLAYDLKIASPEVVEKRIKRTGDGTHFKLGDDESRALVTAIGPLHPLNPSYKTKKQDPDCILSREGVPQFLEDKKTT